MTKKELKNMLETLGIKYDHNLIDEILIQSEAGAKKLYISQRHYASSIVFSMFRQNNSKNRLKMSQVWEEKADILTTVAEESPKIYEKIKKCKEASAKCKQYENSIACLEPIT